MKVFDAGTKAIIFVIIASSVVVGAIAVLFTQTEVTRATEYVLQDKDNMVSAIASRTELRLDDAIGLLQLAAKQDSMKKVSYANLVSEEFMGIPPDLDSERRQIARDLRSVYPDFETVAFILPDGDVYFVEPYTAQQNLPRLNFAFREWYQGIIANGEMYVGEAVVSAATGHRVVPIAVAVYSGEDDASSTLTGILVGALDMQTAQQKLRESKLGANEYMLIVDHKGSIVADTRTGQSDPTQLKSALYLEGAKKALNGNRGSDAETIEGLKSLVTYHTIQAGTNNWATISVQPYSDAFLIVDTISYQAVLTVALIALVSSISGIFLYKMFKSNATLTRRLEKLNQELAIQAKQLRQADKQKGEFAAMITHELKTPLVSIIGYGSMLLNGKLGELTPRQKQKLQIMYTNAERLTALIQDILDVQKLELGEMHLSMKQVSARNIIEESINSLRPQAEAKGIKLVNNLGSDIPFKCDSDRIIQVLNNLVNNGIKFSPNNSRIDVDANLDTDSVIFTVKDGGIGIPKDGQSRLFTKFYQVDTSLTRKAGGTGLGLVVCKGIVEAHKGKIWFESEEGKGSIFSVSIPLGEKFD